MKEFEKIKNYLLKIISNSSLPEDLPHAKNTLDWVLKIYPEADISLKISAIGHDIERALPGRIKREHFKTYDEFKKMHAIRSAQILKSILSTFSLPKFIIEDIFLLVKNHEHGGDFKSDILKDADSLSFFDVNIKFFYEREGFENTLKRAEWGFKRLSERGKKYFTTLNYSDKNLRKIFDILCSKYL